jgi:uncharacterized protein (TIGR03437 family)
MAFSLSAGGQSYEFRYWNDIAPDARSAVKPVDYVRRPNTVAAKGGGFLVSDEMDYRVRWVSLEGAVQSLAGQGSPAVTVPLQAGAQARLSGPREICADGLGAIWIADGGRILRRLSAEGILDSFGVDADTPAAQPSAGLSEAPLRTLSHEIAALACDGSGFAYFADRRSESIVRVSPLGMARRIAGTGTSAKGSAQRIAVEEPPLSYGFWGIDGLSWVEGMLFILDSGRIHRLRLESGTLRSLCTWNERERATQQNWPKRLSAEVSRLLVLEGTARVAEIARSSWDGSHFFVAGRLPQEVFEFSRHEIEITSIARLADGSYVAASAMPPNVYRSWGQDWVPVLGSKVREERIPLALMNGYVPYFDWPSADGEALFLARSGVIGTTVSGGISPRGGKGATITSQMTGPGAEPEWSALLAEQYQGEALAGYRQGDDFVSIYNFSNTSSGFRYEPDVEWLRDGAGAWVKVRREAGIADRRLPNAARAQTLVPPVTGRLNGVTVRARGGMWFWQEGSVYVFDPDLNTSRRVAGNGSNRVVEGTAMQSGWRNGSAKEDSEGRLVQSTDFAITQGADYGQYGVVYRLDAERSSIARVAGHPGRLANARELTEGSDARERQLEAFPRTTPCGAGGRLVMSTAVSGQLYLLDERSVARKIAGSNLPQPTPTGDPMLSGFGLNGFRCFGDGAILIGDGWFQRRTRDLVPTDYVRLKKVFGDEQTGDIGMALGTELTVQTVRFGRAESGRRIRFRLMRGAGTLSVGETVTDGQGLARTRLTLTDRPGPVWVEASADTGATAVFRAVGRFPLRPLPRIALGGVGGAALSVPFLQRLSPGGIATLFGENFTERPVFLEANAIQAGRLPNRLGEVCVETGGQRAFPLAVFPGQINFQVPALPLGREHEVRVIRGCGTPLESSSNGERVLTAASAPEFFYESYSANGRNPVISVRASDGAIGRAKAGDWILLFATGLGPTEGGPVPGQVASSVAGVRGRFRLRIGGINVPEEAIAYVGVAPGTAGQYQINLRIPEGVPTGDLAIVMEADGVSSPMGPFLRIE